MKNKQLLLIGLLFISSYITVKAGHADQIFAPYEKTDKFLDALGKIGYNVLFNLLSRTAQAPVDIVVPLLTHIGAEKINENVLKKPEYVKEALTIEAMKTDLEAKKKLNNIAVEKATDELIQSRIDKAKASQMAVIMSIKNNPDLSDQERNEKIKQKKKQLDDMLEAFTARLTEDALKGSSIKENPAALPTFKKEEPIIPTPIIPTTDFNIPSATQTKATENPTSTPHSPANSGTQQEVATPVVNPMPA